MQDLSNRVPGSIVSIKESSQAHEIPLPILMPNAKTTSRTTLTTAPWSSRSTEFPPTSRHHNSNSSMTTKLFESLHQCLSCILDNLTPQPQHFVLFKSYLPCSYKNPQVLPLLYSHTTLNLPVIRLTQEPESNLDAVSSTLPRCRCKPYPSPTTNAEPPPQAKSSLHCKLNQLALHVQKPQATIMVR